MEFWSLTMVNTFLKKVALGSILTAAMAMGSAAQASTITYDLDLTGTSGDFLGGYGQIVIVSPSTTAYQETFSAGTNGGTNGGANGLLAMSFTIDGETFDIANSTGTADLNVNLDGKGDIIAYNSIDYSGAVNGGQLTFKLSSGGFSYEFVSSNYLLDSGGTISLTPLPSSWAMLLGAFGILGAGAVAQRKFKGSASNSAQPMMFA